MASLFAVRSRSLKTFSLLSSIPTSRLCYMAVSNGELDSFFAPPKSVRGLTTLDRGLFTREIQLPAVKISDPSLCSKFLSRLSHVVLKYPHIKKVVNVPNEDGKESKALLLLPNELRPLPLSSADHEWIAANGGKEVTHTVRLTYPESYSMAAILRAVLPDSVQEVPSGFEVVGHIAHFNLREELTPYKTMIGQVTLDKHKRLKTVVNKMDQIDNTFRFFSMEVLAGEDNMVTTVEENGCSFQFDFSKVYWNSRLHFEHGRIVEMLRSGEVVLDVFAGVGPFAIPAAKKGCTVYANDLNPHSHKHLCENVVKNHVDKRVRTYNMDGRDFIRTVTDDLLSKLKDGQNALYSQVLMNLPASAHEFLDTFTGLFRQVPEANRLSLSLPTIHCYGFSKSLDAPEQDSLETVTKSLGVNELIDGTYSLSVVRKVAPNKVMTRVSFKLPEEVAYAIDKPNDNESDVAEPLPKKAKTE